MYAGYVSKELFLGENIQMKRESHSLPLGSISIVKTLVFWQSPCPDIGKFMETKLPGMQPQLHYLQIAWSYYLACLYLSCLNYKRKIITVSTSCGSHENELNNYM